LLAVLMETPALAPRTRVRPALVPTLAAIAGVALFVTAGNWQRDRMEQKLALRAQFDAATAAAPVALPDLRDWTPWRYRQVTMTGIYDASRQILLDNKVHDGRSGYQVVTPLTLAEGRVVLVNRGWVAGGATRVELPKVAPPAGIVSVRGRINIPPAGYVELKHDAPVGPVWQNLDPQRFAQVTGVRVPPIVVEQLAPNGSPDTLVRDWPAPDFGAERNRMYMYQWYTFAAMAAGLWLFFTLRRSR
jgi:surfeit locus 1 family protein